MEYVIIYFSVALLTSLGFSAWDNGKRWDMGRYLFLGGVWPVALIVISLILLVRKVKHQ